MSYKIAIASSDEKQIDETFGLAKRFLIYQVSGGHYVKLEERIVKQDIHPSDCETGSGGGCAGGAGTSARVELLTDCRCVVCKKAGFNIQKQLERKAIAVFDVNCSVEEALVKISHYFSRIDSHQSLRG
ncbi:NifB/NifX family molybdenum-iron cluster-binding protein [Novisyntrophococcus fermenticellae]|uniref:NifB/NifX family molybdenum-iron cluster-binding protein n=1 Tax=Novisyntrophococcus fermenticellae TaxID=2068655 RepID=UPI001E62C519|nr:NifB/NifX family molybdenum-iron cluster-binding protein [Novisyntrophococcus fermenticellae]